MPVLNKSQFLAQWDFPNSYLKRQAYEKLNREIDLAAENGFCNSLESVQLSAVRKSGLVLGLITNPSFDIQMAGVSKNAYALCFLENPDPRVVSAAIRQNPDVIYTIAEPTEEDAIYALQHRTPGFISYVKNHSPRVIVAWLQRCFDLFEDREYMNYSYMGINERIDYFRRNMKIAKKWFTEEVQDQVAGDTFFRTVVNPKFWSDSIIERYELYDIVLGR